MHYRFIGHMIRGQGMENIVTTGKIQGKRFREVDKEKKSWMVCVDGWCKIQQRHFQGYV
jgi:hypothetical protein